MFEHKPLQNLAYDYLLKKIYTREMRHDTIYSETRIAKELNLSRTPIRDALNRLAFEHYIDIIPNRGFRLHKPSIADLREAYHVRLMMESYCADIVARDIDQDTAKIVVIEMESALNQQKYQVNSGKVDVEQFWQEDLRFHRAVLGYLNISSFITQYNAYVYAFMPQLLNDENAQPRYRTTILEHEEIIEAIRSGDSSKVLDRIHHHLDVSFQTCSEEAR